MIKDLTDSLKVTMYERATSPMAGVFVLSWLAFNWRVPLVLFWGNRPTEERVAFVTEQYLANPEIYLYYPLYSAIGVLILYPILSLLPFYWWHWSSSLKIKLKQKIDGGVLLTKDQSIQIRGQIYKSKEEHRKEIDSHTEEADYLRKRINTSQEKEAAINAKLSKSSQRADNLEKTVDAMNNSSTLKNFVIQKLSDTLTAVARTKDNA